MYFPLSYGRETTPPRICKWYFASGRQTQQRAMFSPQPTNRTGLFLFSPGFSSSSFSISISTHPTYTHLRQHCGRKRPQGKRHWFLFLRSISRFAGQFSSRLPQLCHPFSLYRHFKFSIGRIFSILQAMNFLITLCRISSSQLLPFLAKTQATIFPSIFMRSDQIEVDNPLV